MAKAAKTSNTKVSLTVKKKSNNGNPLIIDGFTNSEMQPQKNTFSEFKKKSMKLIQDYEDETYVKTREAAVYRDGFNNLVKAADKLKDKCNALETRNQFLEKNNGDIQIKKMNNILKKGTLNDDRREEIDQKYNELEDDLSKIISKYYNDPKLSDKKKR
jgi:hypothetical protein